MMDEFRMIKTICAEIGVTPRAVLHPDGGRYGRTRRVSRARHACMWALTTSIDLTVRETAEEMRRDPSTVRYGIRRFDAAICCNERWATNVIDAIEEAMICARS